jgi:PPOX class probable F420-dependent enzyme
VSPTLNDDAARRRFAEAPVAVLASLESDGAPHLVPITFAVRPDDPAVVLSVVDAKPKRTTALHRHATIAANPRVGLLVQHWDADWSRLWWVRADGTAKLSDSEDLLRTASDLLRAKYPQYERMALTGPVIQIRVDRYRGWAAEDALT